VDESRRKSVRWNEGAKMQEPVNAGEAAAGRIGPDWNKVGVRKRKVVEESGES